MPRIVVGAPRKSEGAPPSFGPVVPSEWPAGWARVMCVGEAPGAQETQVGRPFVGASGQVLREMLRESGVRLEECGFGNVFGQQPPRNMVKWFCAGKREVTEEAGGKYELPPLDTKSGYVRPRWLGEKERLLGEIEERKPWVVVALGNTPCWALLGKSGISKLRGGVAPIVVGGHRVKVVPTFHPAAALRAGELFPLIRADLLKAAREARYPEYRRPERWVLHSPTIAEVEGMLWQLRREPPAVPVAVDIETRKQSRLVSCVGFAPREDVALVVPFMGGGEGNYWESVEEEARAWLAVKGVLEDPNVGKVFHNGAYDTVVLGMQLGIWTRGWVDDTMLRWHSSEPELPKALGVLGSIFTDEPSWKLMRRLRADEQLKREE